MSQVVSKQRELVEQLGVGRSSLRESLSALEALIFEAIRNHDPRAAKRAVDEMYDLTDEIVLASKKDSR